MTAIASYFDLNFFFILGKETLTMDSSLYNSSYRTFVLPTSIQFLGTSLGSFGIKRHVCCSWSSQSPVYVFKTQQFYFTFVSWQEKFIAFSLATFGWGKFTMSYYEKVSNYTFQNTYHKKIAIKWTHYFWFNWLHNCS